MGGFVGGALNAVGNITGRGLESAGSGLGRAGEGVAGKAQTTGYKPPTRQMSDRTYNQVMNEYASVRDRPVEKVSGKSSDLQAQQLQAMQQQVAGQAPSQTDIAAERAGAQAVAQQRAMAASQRGSANPALAQRQAMQNTATAQQDIAGQAMQSRLSEQKQYLDALTQGRQQDIGTAQANAQIQAYADEYKKQLLAMGMSADQANLQAQVEADRMSAQIEMANTANRQQAFMFGAGLAPQMISGLMSGVSSALTGGVGGAGPKGAV